jgi:NAD(P)-dependent dehydrogenase (short-subunit alcohol dehydrogenase family)
MTQHTPSRDGFEMTLAVNHLSHFLLTNLLLPLLKRSAAPRVVTVSSMVHTSGRMVFEDMNSELIFNGFHAYSNSKLANILFANELARREHWLTSNSLHPGVIGTKLLHAAVSMSGADVASGAHTSAYLAVAPDVAEVTGNYFDDCISATAAVQAQDQQLARRLWVWSEDAVQDFLDANQAPR